MDDTVGPRHRATYLLERGLWRATCRVCGWQVTEPNRRQAASLFRQHISAERSRAAVIDLTLGAMLSGGGADIDVHAAVTTTTA